VLAGRALGTRVSTSCARLGRLAAVNVVWFWPEAWSRLEAAASKLSRPHPGIEVFDRHQSKAREAPVLALEQRAKHRRARCGKSVM
jgi:hypothetical protein